MASDLFVLPLTRSSQEAKLEKVAPPPETAAPIEHAAEAASEPVAEEAKSLKATSQHYHTRRFSPSMTGGGGH